MMLHRLLATHAENSRPVRVALMGAGAFGSMVMAQCPAIPGIDLVGVADPDLGRVRRALSMAGWSEDRIGALTLSEDAAAVIAGDVDVVIEACGSTAGALYHAQACLREGRSLIMATPEADTLVGPLLAAQFQAAGLIYSLPAGDQPALAADLVDWARTCGFPVVAAGRGSRYLPSLHHSTPDTVWRNLGLSPAETDGEGARAQALNALVDGTKAAEEMAQLANCTGLRVQRLGLAFPPVGTSRLPEDMRARQDGGILEDSGVVEVVSSLNRDGSPIRDHLQHGVYVVVEAPSAMTARRFRDYGMTTDTSGRFAALWRPVHLFGLETGVSIASVAVLKQPTGAPHVFSGDVVAVAKKVLHGGERLDGGGGYTVWGRLMPAEESLVRGALPISLARDAEVVRDVTAGQVLTWDDVRLDQSTDAYRLRHQMEGLYAKKQAA